MRIFASIAAVLAIAFAVGFAVTSTASAGEWSKGNGGDAARDVFYAGKASVCSFNGADEPDSTEDHGGAPHGDDEMWGSTPAGGKAQSGGQIVALLGPNAIDFGGDPEDNYPGVVGTGFGVNAEEGCTLKADDFGGH